MKTYYIKKNGQYINYIFSFNELLKLKSTNAKINNNRVARLQPHIVYTEQEARRILLIEKGAYLVPIEN